MHVRHIQLVLLLLVTVELYYSSEFILVNAATVIVTLTNNGFENVEVLLLILANSILFDQDRSR